MSRLHRALFLVAVLACRDAPRRETVPDSAAATSAASTPASAGGSCPATGRWAACSVVERLERSGLAPRAKPDSVREPPLSVPGAVFALGAGELRVFLYPDRAAQERDAARLDRDRYIAADAPITMRGESTLIRSENLLAILLSRSDTQRERVANALEAGPPR